MSYPNIINEIKSKVTYSDALFLGDVKFNTDSPQIALKSTKDNIQFNINGGTAYNRGAWIALEGCDNTSGNFPAGSFNIRATNSSGNYCDFRGTAEGSLSWNSNDVITSAGGTMKGILNIPSNGIRGNKIDGCIHIYAGTDYTNGAILRLCGNSEANSGEFSLWAGGNGSGSKQLHGYPNGTLTWANSKVLTDADATTITQWGLPNYNGIISGIGSTYTAPHNGFVSFNKSGTSNATVNGITVYLGGNDAYNEGNVILYLKKGDTISVAHDSGTMCFVPLYHGG